MNNSSDIYVLVEVRIILVSTGLPGPTTTRFDQLQKQLLVFGFYVLSLVCVHLYDVSQYAPRPVPAPIPGPGPGPGPIPNPNPIPPKPSTIGNLRVLVLYESSDNLSRNELSVINSSVVRTYLNAHTISDTGVAAWRFWDKDVDASNESKAWQSALATAKTDPVPLPKILFFAGTSLVKSVPLPPDEASTLDLLTLYGGK